MTVQHEQSPRSPLVEAVARLERAEELDPAVAALEPAADALVADRRRRALLHGDYLGHALHPVLTDVPIGAWTSAAVLDLFPTQGSEAAARRLIGLGILAAAPTAVTGLAEWAVTGRIGKRVGVVHAALNSAALGLYALSWLSRGRGTTGAGKLSGLLGLSTVMASAYLGGHLAIGRKVGTNHPDFRRDGQG